MELDQRVQIAVELLAESTNTNGRLTHIAQRLRLSESRLRHLIRTEIGLPPGKYCRLVKMQYARRLLEQTFMSVKEISHKAGFGDTSHFVRDFKKLFGTSPTDYRRLVSVRSATKSANI